MADFTAPAPVETEKSAVVHDRETRPDAPADRQDLGRMLLLIAVGVLFTAALVALAYQARASWTEVRDWVVPVTIPFYAIGGISLAYLVLRRAWMAASTGLTLLFLTVALTGFNLWRAALTTGPDGLRDSLSITAGVLLGVTIAALAAAMIWVEARRPSRPPAPEL
ncbi:MAG: hypothetical protein OXE43_04255 [Chloroflexi bacterium]|nr:hypothetical protein [Chloroflexota bacterium]